jgi:hypothetical protein
MARETRGKMRFAFIHGFRIVKFRKRVQVSPAPRRRRMRKSKLLVQFLNVQLAITAAVDSRPLLRISGCKHVFEVGDLK